MPINYSLKAQPVIKSKPQSQP